MSFLSCLILLISFAFFLWVNPYSLPSQLLLIFSNRAYFLEWFIWCPLNGDCSHEIKRHLLLGRKVMTNLDSIFKSRDVTLPTKVHLVKAMVFPVIVYGCESWTIKSWPLKNWCFWTVVLEKTLESPLDCKEIKPINPKGNQSWIFNGRTDAAAENPILWPPGGKNRLIGKDPDAGKDWRQEEKGTTREWDGWMASPTQWT